VLLPYALAPLPPLSLPRPLPLPCPAPRLGPFSASSAFIIGALLRPALETCIAAGAVDGGGQNGSLKASSASAVSPATSSSSSSSAAAAVCGASSKRGGGILIHPVVKKVDVYKSVGTKGAAEKKGRTINILIACLTFFYL
jgi:hypothetical protein